MVILGFFMQAISLAFIAGFIYLIYTVRKRKAEIFQDGVEPEVAERRYRQLRTTLQVAGVAAAVAIIGTIVHNVLYATTDEEEPISFFFGAGGLLVFTLATISSFVMFIRGRGAAA